MSPCAEIGRLDFRGRTATASELRVAMPRGATDVDAVLHQVRPIIEAVRDRGVDAAIDYSERFDGIRQDRVRVPQYALLDALAALDDAVREALEVTIARARSVHEDQRRTDTTTDVAPGGTVTERWVPVERVGLYVPGGSAVYPSSVVMNVVPAQTAGVQSLVVASPPQPEFGGLPHPTVLAAAHLLGVDEVWAVGGAQSIALMTYGGTDTDGGGLEPVDLITGPGNVFVTAAKRLCRGLVGIDAEAGPTEILILADATANPVHIAADLISQAEHDEMAASILVTTSIEQADAVEEAVNAQLASTRHLDRIITALSGRQSRVVLVDDIEQGLAVVNAYGPEHLEVHTQNSRDVADRVRSAGAIFVGTWSPVSLGDYCAGSNHVLPTGGSARHSSGLGVQTFLRGIHVVDYSEAALKDVALQVIALANAEDLPAHGEAVRLRFANPE